MLLLEYIHTYFCRKETEEEDRNKISGERGKEHVVDVNLHLIDPKVSYECIIRTETLA